VLKGFSRNQLIAIGVASVIYGLVLNHHAKKVQQQYGKRGA
jgi:hypothetical protein